VALVDGGVDVDHCYYYQMNAFGYVIFIYIILGWRFKFFRSFFI
jgi:hypothetical protein